MVSILCLLIQLYMLVIFARIVVSWVVGSGAPPTPGTAYAQIVDGLVRVTEPVLAPVRAMVPPVRMGAMGFDLSPIIVVIVLILVSRAICG